MEQPLLLAAEKYHQCTSLHNPATCIKWVISGRKGLTPVLKLFPSIICSNTHLLPIQEILRHDFSDTKWTLLKKKKLCMWVHLKLWMMWLNAVHPLYQVNMLSHSLFEDLHAQVFSIWHHSVFSVFNYHTARFFAWRNQLITDGNQNEFFSLSSLISLQSMPHWPPFDTIRLSLFPSSLSAYLDSYFILCYCCPYFALLGIAIIWFG